MNKPLNAIPVTTLKGVGGALAEKLAKIGIHNIQDLLFHLPLRYQDRTRITPIGALQLDGDSVVQGTVAASDIVMGRRRSCYAVFTTVLAPSVYGFTILPEPRKTT